MFLVEPLTQILQLQENPLDGLLEKEWTHALMNFLNIEF